MANYQVLLHVILLLDLQGRVHILVCWTDGMMFVDC